MPFQIYPSRKIANMNNQSMFHSISFLFTNSDYMYACFVCLAAVDTLHKHTSKYMEKNIKKKKKKPLNLQENKEIMVVGFYRNIV